MCIYICVNTHLCICALYTCIYMYIYVYIHICIYNILFCVKSSRTEGSDWKLTLRNNAEKHFKAIQAKQKSGSREMNKQSTSFVFTISGKQRTYLTPGRNIPYYKRS